MSGETVSEERLQKRLETPHPQATDAPSRGINFPISQKQIDFAQQLAGRGITDKKEIIEQGKKQGFTLVELLVVVSIIGLLVGILVPVASRARQLTRRTQCKSNLHEIVKGCQIYANNSGGRYPIDEEETSTNAIWGADKYYLHGRLLGADIVKKEVFWCPSHNGSLKIDSEQYGAQNIGQEGKTSKIPYYIRGIPQGGPARTGGENKSLLQDLEVRPNFTNHGTELYPVVNSGFTDGSAKGFEIPEEQNKWKTTYVSKGGNELDGDGNIIKTGTWTQFDRGETEPIPD